MILMCDVLSLAHHSWCSPNWFLKRIETMVYGYVTMAITAYVIDAVLSGNRQSVQMFIFSKKYDEISDRITKQIGRGVTVIDGQGWYTKENLKVAITLVRKHESSDIYKIIKEIDPEAFISVANVMGVYGRGFEKIKL